MTMAEARAEARRRWYRGTVWSILAISGIPECHVGRIKDDWEAAKGHYCHGWEAAKGHYCLGQGVSWEAAFEDADKRAWKVRP